MADPSLLAQMLRRDGTKKGAGYFGPLLRPDGMTSTELSFDFDTSRGNVLAPLLVPTLTKQELDELLSGGAPTPEIYEKATQHAIERQRVGKPTFATPFDVFPLPK